MQDKKIVRLNGIEAIEAKKQLIELLQAEGKLQLEKIIHEDSSIKYHFSTKSDQSKNVVVDIQVNDTIDCGELENFAV